MLSNSHPTAGKWESSFAVLAGLYGASSLVILAVGRETYYPKGLNTQETPRWKSFLGLGNTITLNKLPTAIEQSKALVIMIFTPAMLLVGLASMVNFTWPIRITITIFIPFTTSLPPYVAPDASMLWAGTIGALLGFVFGYFFNPWIYLSPSPSGVSRRVDWYPEYRLHGVWSPIFSTAIGLVIYGLTLNFQKSWIGLAFGWNLVNLEMIASTVAITAFALEKNLPYARLSERLSTCGARAVASQLYTSSPVGLRGAEWASYGKRKRRGGLGPAEQRKYADVLGELQYIVICIKARGISGWSGDVVWPGET
ncbi:hypothetical protein V496_08494 [Pseudogymnoascus sp. VKM F-4515 (FW-2607)]|nr:hypothetical protein V496_08494 [Pseudogymnoascus sp. VKM F-4515 (FW-2607)]